MATITSLKKIENPVEGRCIEVDSEDKLFSAGGTDGMSVVTHNSVCQRSIFVRCIMSPEDWAVIGIDLKRVKLSAYRKYKQAVLAVATTLSDALISLRFAQQTMMKRYSLMEQLGVNNFLDLPNRGRALLVMIDEAGQLLDTEKGRALEANTPVLMADGSQKPIADLQLGDTVVGEDFAPCNVLDKYIPHNQQKFSMTFSRDDNEPTQEGFVAGAEHKWPCYLYSASTGKVLTHELKLTSAELYDLLEHNKNAPDDQKVTVRLKRSATPARLKERYPLS